MGLEIKVVETELWTCDVCDFQTMRQDRQKGLPNGWMLIDSATFVTDLNEGTTDRDIRRNIKGVVAYLCLDCRREILTALRPRIGTNRDFDFAQSRHTR